MANVIEPAHPDYDRARRVWNGDIDRRPTVIVQCQGVADVIAAVNASREHTMTLAIRGGAHNVAGHATCDDGMVIDVSPMKGIWVAPGRMMASAQTGVVWRELDRETQTSITWPVTIAPKKYACHTVRTTKDLPRSRRRTIQETYFD